MLGIAEYQWGEHLMPWSSDGRRLLPAPSSLLRKAAARAQLYPRFYTQARLREPETESSYPLWINKDSVPPPPPPTMLVSAFKWISDESGREERRTFFFYVDRQCAKVRSAAQHPPLLRSTQTQEARWDPHRTPPPLEVTRFSLKISSTFCLSVSNTPLLNGT